jgi:hypothetical protein
MSTTIGQAYHTGDEGWSEVTPSEDSLILYQDPVAGDDANPGTEAEPLETLQEAFDRFESGGKPNHLYIKKGTTQSIDVSVSNPFDTWEFKPGRSADELTLVSSYGPDAAVPPIIDFTSPVVNDSETVVQVPDYSAIIGITFRARQSDFRDVLYEGVDQPFFGIGPRATFAKNFYLFEDCAFISIGVGSNDVGGTYVFRRNKVMCTPGLGLYTKGVDLGIIHENFLYHCGWKPQSMGGTRTGGMHNVYIQSNADSGVYQALGNMSAWGNFHAWKMRHGGLLKRSVVWRSQEFTEAGAGGGGGTPLADAGPVEIEDNFAVNMGEDTSVATGMIIGDCNRPVLIRRNFFLQVKGSGTNTLVQCTAASHDTVVDDTYAINHGSANSNAGTGNTVEAPITSTTGMIDPERDIDSYSEFLGLGTTPIWEYSDDALVQAIEGNRRYNFNEAYSNLGLWSYLNAGYSVNYQRLQINCAA